MPTLRSPRYNLSLAGGTIAANGDYYVNFREISETAEQIPYNNILIRNFSSCRLKVEYGQTVAIVGSSEVFADDEAYGTTALKITNLTNSAQDDLIYITASRDVSEKHVLIAYLTGENLHSVANGDI